MRERIATIVLVVLVTLGGLGLCFMTKSAIPLFITIGLAYAWYTLGTQNGFRDGIGQGARMGYVEGYKDARSQKPSTDPQQGKNYRERNYERYLEWRSGRD